MGYVRENTDRSYSLDYSQIKRDGKEYGKGYQEVADGRFKMQEERMKKVVQ